MNCYCRDVTKNDEDYEELEEMRREASAIVGMTSSTSFLGRLANWILRWVEKEQKEILDNRFKRGVNNDT